MMKTRIKKLLSLIFCIVLIAAMALFTTGCKDSDTTNKGTEAPAETESQTETESPKGETESMGKNVLGEGAVQFAFTVVDKDGNETQFEIHTDCTIVGDALMEHELIAGEEDQYGLYVKEVNGITADYDKDGVYWAFYVNGEYAMSGVDTTKIEAGSEYTFKVEK